MTRATRLAYPLTLTSAHLQDGGRMLPSCQAPAATLISSRRCPAASRNSPRWAPSSPWRWASLSWKARWSVCASPGRCAPKKPRGGVGATHQPGLTAEQVAGVLGRENERPVVLANPPGQPDDETAHHGVLE